MLYKIRSRAGCRELHFTPRKEIDYNVPHHPSRSCFRLAFQLPRRSVRKKHGVPKDAYCGSTLSKGCVQYFAKGPTRDDSEQERPVRGSSAYVDYEPRTNIRVLNGEGKKRRGFHPLMFSQRSTSRPTTHIVSMPRHLRTPTPLKTPRGFILNPCFDLLRADPVLSTIGFKRSSVSSRRFSSSLRSKLTRAIMATAYRQV